MSTSTSPTSTSRVRPVSERLYSVLLHGDPIGELHGRDTSSSFRFIDGYFERADRFVLGLHFEENREALYRSAQKLPPWFSNLLPEGILRTWIAEQRGVSDRSELELLAEVGHDLPGAVTVVAAEPAARSVPARVVEVPPPPARAPRMKFSLAGVQLKLSLLRQEDRFVAPASGDRGDFILKLPDASYPHVPRNELAMMRLAKAVGLDVPDAMLVHRDEIEGMHDATFWPRGEDMAYAVRRFDRSATRTPIHMEDFAQVRGIYADDKYHGSFETVAALAYRGRHTDDLHEVARRIGFNLLVRNADAHLKNWSLLYPDGRKPRLSPAYDIVSTAVYPDIATGQDLGLKLGGSRRFERIRLSAFRGLANGAGAPGEPLDEVVEALVKRVIGSLDVALDVLADTGLGPTVEKTVKESAAKLQRIAG